MTRAPVVMMFFVSSLALAQAAAPVPKQLQDKAEIKFNEIERGFTVEMALGGHLMFNLPGQSVSPTDGSCGGRPFSGAGTVRADVGAHAGARGARGRGSAS